MTLAPILDIDLGALVANWRALDALSAPQVETAAVLKADAYGCGAARVGPALARAGARSFFVALAGEGAALRSAIGPGPTIYILGGYDPGDAQLFAAHDLAPVLNATHQIDAWARDRPGAPMAVQLDTGMGRLGLPPGAPVPPAALILSHLACADDPGHPLNRAQCAAFQGPGRRSLAATGGVLLGPDYHFALTRPGIGLYGGLPFAAARPVVRLRAPIIQTRDVAPGAAVGYGAAWVADRPARIATVAIGYADGLPRRLWPGAAAWLDGHPLPLAGRVSMDLITLDVTDCPAATPGALVDLIGPDQPLDTLAGQAGTIGYEILTGLGTRAHRRYTGG